MANSIYPYLDSEDIWATNVINTTTSSGSGTMTVPQQASQQAYPDPLNSRYSGDFQVVALNAAKRGVAEAFDDKVKEARANRRRALGLGSVSSAYKRHKKKEAKKLIEVAWQEYNTEISKLDAKLREYEQRKYAGESERQRREYQKHARSSTLGGVGGVTLSSTNTFQAGETLTITGGGTGSVISASGGVKFDPITIENLKEQLGIKKKK